ncbi:MAG: type transport system ATP-binding protein [Actinomycetota bacterium]|jgi:ABC-type polysaccharide/polyol phosphate transport system ATPase subunit|nr:type transport system ATP-binding protein [Actinomycetota bacterium]
MSGAPLFVARGVGKRYTLRPERSIVLGLFKRERARSFWALRHLDLEVHPGEVVGVIGRNGAGKSTFLKVAAGVSTPNEGTLQRPRFIAPLIEVGAGFHPELTGRENVELNAQLLGLSPKEVRARFDDIVEFAGVAYAIDQPVKQYSSGMFMRLGFSIAVHTTPELLVVDEVLAVGDIPFQTRCIERIEAMRAEGVGVLFVSHSLSAVQRLCDRAVLLEKGEPVAEGDATTVVAAYQRRITSELHGTPTEVVDMGPTGDLQLLDVEAVNTSGTTPEEWQPGDLVTVRFQFAAYHDAPAGRINVGIERDGAGMVSQWHSGALMLPPMVAGQHLEVTASFRLNVAGGTYFLTGSVSAVDWSVPFVSFPRCLRFEVEARPGAIGLVDVEPSFSLAEVTV